MHDREAEWTDLMRAALGGDDQAYRRLLRSLAMALRPSVGSFAHRTGLAAGDVEDVVQETLLAIHLKRATWRDGEPVGAWARAIARNKAIDALRRRGRHVHVPVDVFAETLAAPQAEVHASARDIERSLAALPEGQRAAVQAVSVEQLSLAEAARKLSVSEGALRVALHRGLKSLARRAGEDPR
jgi:RNA polymerase sigma-70 factor (ECF subfamily)